MFSRVTYPGISFNDNDNFLIDGVPGLSGAAVRHESFDMPQADYGVFVDARYGRRAFSLTGMIIGTTADEFIDLRDQLATAFSPFNGEQPLVFEYTSRPARQINAVIAGEAQFDPSPMSPFACEFRIPMVASFPFLVGTTLNTATLTLSLTGGAAVPAVVPMSLSPNSGGNAYIANAGTAPAYPEVRITGPILNPALRNMNTGQDVQLNLELLDGEWVDLDFRLFKAYDQFSRNRYGSLIANWWKLGRGTTEVRLVADSTDQSAQAILGWRDTYLNV